VDGAGSDDAGDGTAAAGGDTQAAAAAFLPSLAARRSCSALPLSERSGPPGDAGARGERSARGAARVSGGKFRL
jgi:hypothetical protein